MTRVSFDPPRFIRNEEVMVDQLGEEDASFNQEVQQACEDLGHSLVAGPLYTSMSKLELRPEQRGYLQDFTAVDMESGVLRMTRPGRVKVVRAFADACQENQSTKKQGEEDL